MRRKLVVANWKSNGSQAANNAWVEGFTAFAQTGAELVVCPPSVYITALRNHLMESAVLMAVGAQNCSAYPAGAYTGEVTAEMLSDIGAAWVILGHSERRQLFGETDAVVAQKAKAALEAGLRPIVCVGETLQEREAGKTEEVVLSQLKAVLDVIGAEGLANGALAYEPIWAIGTGKTATCEQAEAVHKVLRNSVKSLNSEAGDALRILYGGSVKPANASELFKCPNIDGGLIGGASLKAADFYAIAQAASTVQLI